jgi:GAF domain-containing protein
MSITEELARREERLAKLAEARAKLDAGAKERFEREMAEHRAKLASRDQKTAAKPKDQINLTDEDSRIMPVTGGGFEQCYNAQAVVRPKAFS